MGYNSQVNYTLSKIRTEKGKQKGEKFEERGSFSLNPILIFLLVGNLILFLGLIFLALSFQRFKENYRRVSEAAQKGNFTEMINEYGKNIQSILKGLEEINLREKRTLEVLQGTVQRIGLVRFDAFDDVGGNLSFAAALLNEKGDGLVISTINGRSESRSYAKLLVKGEAQQQLSKEEEEAIKQALS